MQFDLTKIRVLQEDENKSAERLGAMLGSGGITVAEYRRALGYIVLPEHEVYLRAGSVKPVPAGLSPEEQVATVAPPPPQPALNGTAPNNGKADHLLEEVLAVVAQA
jgi:hypothetical protein